MDIALYMQCEKLVSCIFFFNLKKKKMFLFSFIKTGTINYMSPEVIRDTSSQSGKARSKVLLQSFFNTLICHFWTAL